ncbi:MAG: DNA polymerase III subunit delta [Bacteroidia bacterium]
MAAPIIEAYNKLIKEIQSRHLKPIYFLHGNESFFIDQISDFIENNVLTEAEKAFNQHIYYVENPVDFEPNAIIEICRRYPMMSDYQVVILKEAQRVPDWDFFIPYFDKPAPSTILVICHKEKKLSSKETFVRKHSKHITFFESDKLNEDKDFPDWINSYINQHGFSAHKNVVMLIAEHTGNSLTKATNELNKLMILKDKSKEITEDDIEKNLGISKDYNSYELVSSIANLNATRSFFIAENIKKNKEFHILAFLPLLNTNFSKALAIKQSNTIIDSGKKWGYINHTHKAIAKNYSTEKIYKVINILKEYDLKSKGIGANSIGNDFLNELLFKIFVA